MKKQLLFKTFIALLISMNVMAQNVPNYVPTNGLVGWWPFNGNANDESGNGHNGTVNGAKLTNDRNGVTNSAYSFTKTQYIEIKNLYQNNITGYSVSAWFKRSINNSDGSIVSGSYPTETPGGLRLTLGTINRFQWGIEDKPGVNGILQNSPGDNNNYCDNNWHHVVATFLSPIGKVSSKSFNIYVDGNLVKIYSFHQNWPTWDTTTYSPINNVNRNTILGNCGGSYFNFTNGFNGILDDIAIYNRALTQQEITALYTGDPPCTNPTATITPQGNTTFCQGGSVNLNATTGSNYAYQWYNNIQIINGATASTYQASTSGNYTVKITDGACNATSSATTVTVNQYPSSGVNVSGNTTFCQGGSVTLSAQGAGSYLWSNGATSQSIVVNQSGTYSVAVTANGCTSNSDQMSITVNPLPTATITPQGNTTFCQGGFVNLVANGGTSYQWNTSSTSASITATQSGTYTVNVFNQYNCQATASQVVTVNPLPNVTMNALNQFTLKNTTPIQLVANPSGGTFSGDGVQGTTFNPSLTTLGTKTISYNYTSPQGCSGNAVRSTIVVDSIGNVCSTYDTLKIKVKLTTGINMNQFTSMRVYPNPTSDVLVIDAAEVQALNGYRYRILDILGKEVYNALVTSAKTEISLKSLGAKGVYVLHIMDANNASIQTKQIVLE
jgi:hypothetical protein